MVTPDTSFDLPPQIQVADRTINDAEDRGRSTLTHAPDPRAVLNVGAITIGLQLGQASASTTGCRKFGFGKPTGIDLPGEERGIVLPLEKYSGSSMGNLPIGQGESVTPMQIAHGLRARSPTAGSCAAARRAPRRRQARRRAAPASAIIKRVDRRRSCATMLEGVFAAGRHRLGGLDPRLQAGGQDRHGEQGRPGDRRVLRQSHYVASFVGFAPAGNPKLLDRRHGRRAAGRDLRRRGRGPGVRQDRPVRAALPEASPEPASSGGLAAMVAAMLLGDLFGDGALPDVEVTRARLRRARRHAGHACSSACAASRATATTSRPTRSPRGAVALVVDRPLDLGVPEVRVDDVRAAMAPAAARLQRRPDRARWRWSGSPGPTARRRPRSSSRALLEAGGPPDRAARDRDVVGRRRASARSCARRPRRSTCSARSPTMLDGRRHARASWRSPPTRWRCTAPTRSTGRSPSFTNLTQDHLDFHADMEDYFPAKRRLFEAGAAGARWSSTSTTRTARALAARVPGGDHDRHRRARRRAARDRRASSAPAARRFTLDGLRCASPLPGPLQRPQRARARSPRPARSGVDDATIAAALPRRRARARALRAGRRGPGLRGHRRLRPHARRAGQRPARRPRAGRRRG